MASSSMSSNIDSDVVPMTSLPKTALQAIYHAVTGKTENMSRELSGNVFISSADIDRIYEMIRDQMGHYTLLAEPTVTIIVKCANSKSITYSSWERYQVLRVNNHDVTSEIDLKFEVVMILPETDKPQRCIINLSFDSSLPMIMNRHKGDVEPEALGFLLFMRSEWRSVTVSIDFVDFLVAKIFTGVVEEWFGTLKRTPKPKLNAMLVKLNRIFRAAISQFGRIGMAAFLFSYLLFSNKDRASIYQLSEAASIGLFIWALIVVAQTSLSQSIIRRISANIIPTVILLTNADSEAYEEMEKSTNSPTMTIAGILAMALTSIFLNVVSSYAYAYMTQKK